MIILKVYHGSTFIVEKPNLEILNYRTDFGKGFYTTTDINQAKRWTKIKKGRLQEEKRDENIKRYINIYEYTENEDLNILNFESATEEWLKFVFKNRQSNELVHQYDIVIGPVADDNLYQVLVSYENGIYDMEETIKRLQEDFAKSRRDEESMYGYYETAKYDVEFLESMIDKIREKYNVQ